MYTKRAIAGPDTTTYAFLKGIIIILLVNYALTTRAQCTADFGVTNPQNNGVVFFHDSSVYTGQYVKYTIDWGDGITSVISANSIPSNFSHTYYGEGTYYLCMSIADSIDISCSASFCDSVYVSTVNATCNGYYSAIDSMGSYYFIPSVNGVATDFLWDFGDGSTSNVQYPGFHSFSAPGSYIVCFTASNPSSACSFTYCDTLVVPSCTSSFTFVNDSAGGGVSFTSGATGSPDIYSWTFGDGGTSASANPYHLYNANGYYSVCLTVSSSTDINCSATVCNTVQVVGYCDADFDVVMDSVDGSHFWILNSSVINSNTVFHWDFGDGATSNLEYPSHNYSTSGPYNLCLTVSDNNGCSDSLCDSIQAVFRNNAPLSITVINPITLDIKEIAIGNVQLKNYPNPVQHTATVNYTISNASNIELTIVDMLGHSVAQLEKSYKNAGSYTALWQTQDVANGLYLLKLETNEGELVKKIIVAH